jgi:hypothetical protein
MVKNDKKSASAASLENTRLCGLAMSNRLLMKHKPVGSDGPLALNKSFSINLSALMSHRDA